MKKKVRIRLLVVILLLALLIGMIGLASAKYTKTISINGKITFSARLADSIAVQEHEAVRQADGTYVLHDGSTKPGSEETYPNEIVNSNAYTLIPGVDIPKDPHIVISGKTKIQACLYLEVLDNTPNQAIEYTLEDYWKETELAPKNLDGAKVYVYYDKTNNKNFVITSDQTINILKNNTITVNQGLVLDGNNNNSLKFSAYLEEKTANG